MEAEREEYFAAIAELVKSRPASVPILPPKDVLYRVEKTAETVARRGNDSAMLNKLRENSKTEFVNEESSYFPYWEWRLSEIQAGRVVKTAKSGGAGAENNATSVSFQGKQVKVPEKPDDFRFSARMPIISAQDLDVIRLTAKHAAANGQSWVNQLAQRMAGNPDFDFLRRQHSLHLFYESLRDQYKLLFESETAIGGEVLKRQIAELELTIRNPRRIIERARKRAEYNKYQESQKVAREEKIEKDRIAYAQIDWHNFTVIQPAIVFDEDDEARDLPPPMTLQDLQSQSLEQRAAMRIGVDRRLEEAIPFMDEDTPLPAAQVPQHPAQQQQPYGAYPTPPPQQPGFPPPSLQAERDRAREAARLAPQPQRIVTNYTPAQRRTNAAPQNTSICPNCRQAIPNDEMESHLRIEMLDPQWREQSRIAAQRSATSNLTQADVANNLKRLASQRADVFDQSSGLPVTESEAARRKRVELQQAGGGYDGMAPQQQHAMAIPGVGAQMPPGMMPPPGALPPGALPPGTERLDVQEQIRRLHEKHGNR